MKIFWRYLTIFAVTALFALPAVVKAEDGDDENVYYKEHKEKVMGQVTEDKALVYFLRPGLAGSAIMFWQYVDDKLISVNHGRHYSFALLEPGEHLFWAKAENVSAFKMNVEAGQTYYIQQKVRVGFMRARVKLVLLQNKESIDKALAKSKRYVTPKPAAFKKSDKSYMPKKYEKAKQVAERYTDFKEKPKKSAEE